LHLVREERKISSCSLNNSSKLTTEAEADTIRNSNKESDTSNFVNQSAISLMDDEYYCDVDKLTDDGNQIFFTSLNT
jgi:hypothetical protein